MFFSKYDTTTIVNIVTVFCASCFSVRMTRLLEFVHRAFPKDDTSPGVWNRGQVHEGLQSRPGQAGETLPSAHQQEKIAGSEGFSGRALSLHKL